MVWKCETTCLGISGRAGTITRPCDFKSCVISSGLHCPNVSVNLIIVPFEISVCKTILVWF